MMAQYSLRHGNISPDRSGKALIMLKFNSRCLEI